MNYVQVPVEAFARHWVCGVTRSGYHNGARCSPTDPHDEYWCCGWRYEASVVETVFVAWSQTENKQC